MLGRAGNVVTGSGSNFPSSSESSLAQAGNTHSDVFFLTLEAFFSHPIGANFSRHRAWTVTVKCSDVTVYVLQRRLQVCLSPRSRQLCITGLHGSSLFRRCRGSRVMSIFSIGPCVFWEQSLSISVQMRVEFSVKVLATSDTWHMDTGWWRSLGAYVIYTFIYTIRAGRYPLATFVDM